MHILIPQLLQTAFLLSCILSQSPLRCRWSCCSRSQHGVTQWGSAVRFGEIQHPAWFGSITLNPSLHHHVTASPHTCCVSSVWASRMMESTSAWPRTGWVEPRLLHDSSLFLLVRTIKSIVNKRVLSKCHMVLCRWCIYCVWINQSFSLQGVFS